MTYRQAVAFLESRERFGIRLGLSNVHRLLARLGNPEKSLNLKTFHIAGTNGKGSVARIIAGILTEAGYCTGLYTSPHLIDTRERIQVNNQLISPKNFADLISEIAPQVIALSKFLPHSPTYFETITSAAFLYFARHPVDYAVVEVGMGGRLDATNVINPLVSVITPIGMEHRRFLGNSLAAITGEKAGIIKEGRPVVCSPQAPAALKVLRKKAKELSASFYLTGKDILSALSHPGERGPVFPHASPLLFPRAVSGNPSFSLSYQDETISGLTVSLPGSFQIENVATAWLALQSAGSTITEEDLRNGLAKIVWPGRLQVVSREPLIIFDVSHNPPAIKTLITNLALLYPGRDVRFVMGVLQDKDYRLMLKYLGEYGREFIFTRPDSDRAREPAELKKVFSRIYPGKRCRVIPEPAKAIEGAEKNLGENGLLCICGSFYLAGAISTVIPACLPSVIPACSKRESRCLSCAVSSHL
ncbi:MAG: folylpolyglutamate synthase/dihydrofolate synthase family protein [Candidatus Omnitrophota bacterium]